MSVFAEKLWGGLLDAMVPKRKLLAKLRARWGAVGDKDGYLASRYFELIRYRSPGAWVDDKTWGDLEFPGIFAQMDTTLTPVGSQVLYARLREYDDDPEALARRYARCLALAANAPLREAIQLRLARLADDSHADLAELLFGDRVERPARRTLIWGWGLLSLALLVLTVFFKFAAWPWLAVLLVNALVIFRRNWRQQREAEAMKHCATLLDVADRLAALRHLDAAPPELSRLEDERPKRAAVRRVLFWFALMKIPPVFPVLFAILNLVFLTELAIHAGTIERFFRIRQKLAATFALVGGIDAAIAMASCLQRQPRHCTPAFAGTRTLSVTDGRHPLLPGGVANSIRLERKSILVTGSNMAGKTTFINMLACNAILGQTAGFCFAAAATLPRTTVLASIHGAHSVESGKSHYFAEIEAIDGFIRRGAQGHGMILAIDEPFSGTNTVERIAVARAVLESLGTHAIVLATTHDVELQALLGDDYVLCHFQENPDVDGYFDYRLRPGPARARNAIRLLERMGFPRAITAHAMAYAEQEPQGGMPAAAGNRPG
ncbi:MAG TPA: hypothetical protein VFY97_11065 [Rhodanobacteraceae bacterium]|nr:hypothetical protein [Rhodanobacteraceae bacterium]